MYRYTCLYRCACMCIYIYMYPSDDGRERTRTVISHELLHMSVHIQQLVAISMVMTTCDICKCELHI